MKLLEEIEKKEALEKYGSEGSGKNLPFSSLSEDLKIFCPGIRDVKAAKHDQKRTKSYSEFCHMSKNDSKVYCVIGRPIYESGDAGQNIKKIIQSAN